MRFPAEGAPSTSTVSGRGMYRLQCFGSATLFDPEGQEVHFRSRKHLGLLLYLCAHRNRSLTRGHLAALFWDTEEQLARHSLSQALYDLRKRIEPLTIHARGGSLRLGEGEVVYEAALFEAAVKRGELERAVDLYRGAFSPNLESVGTRSFRRWLEAERSRFATVGQASLRRYIADCDRRGLWGEVCLAALRLVKMDPLDEAGHRSLMKALWLQGDQHSALQHYAGVEGTLVRELPEGPSAATVELIDRIRSSRPPAVESRAAAEPTLPLVGRSREFEALREGLGNLGDRESGHFVIVRGEAGIGKTRLLQELKRVSTVEGFTYLESRCYPAESDVAYGPILDAIEPVASRLATEGEGPDQRYYQLGHLFPSLFRRETGEEQEGVDPAVRRRRLFEEVTDLVRRAVRDGPLVWIVEDIQWIDAASASLLHYVARRLMREQILLILSLRSGQPLREPARLLAEESGPHLSTEIVDLAPLSRQVIRELLEGAVEGSSNRAAIAFAERYAGGNPFFALEIVRAATDARTRGEFPPANGLISDRLRNLLTLRLRGLSARTLRVLEAVAVLERYATPENVAAAGGLTRDGAATITGELRERHLLREREDRVEFVHDIAREFVYSNLGLLQRAALHLTAAEVLAGAPDVNPATLARHFERGGDRARAYEFGMRAARASSSSSAHNEAASMAILAAGVATSAEARFEALRLQAGAELAAGRFREAESHFDAILSLYPELSAERRIPLRLSIMKAKVESSDWTGAFACLRILERELGGVLDKKKRIEWELEARALILKVRILTKDDGGARRTYDAIRSCVEDAERGGDLTSQAQAEALCSQIVYATFHESSTGAAETLQKLDTLESCLSRTRRQQLALYQTVVHIRLAEWDKARAAAIAGLSLARELNDALHTAHFMNNLSCLSLELGRWKDAEHYAQESLAMYAALEIDRYSALPPLLNRANAYFYQGLCIKAIPLYETALEIATENGAPSHRAEVIASLGLIALQQGSERSFRHYADALNHSRAARTGGYDRFKAEWFQAYLHLLGGTSPRVISEDLRAAAEEEETRDKVNYLKLLWLDALLCHTDPSHVTQLLREVELTWFMSFTKRWLRLTRHHGSRTTARVS